MMKLISKKPEEKEENRYSEEEVDWYTICKTCLIRKYTFWYYVVNDELPSTSSQIVEQIEVIQEVVLQGISKLNDSALYKKQEDQTLFSPKETLEKGKWICHCLSYLISHQLIDRVIK